MSTYTASKTRTKRAGWSVIFRHPGVVNPDTGKPGKRMRYGLGTRDDDEAQRQVDALNALLADERWWSASARGDAASRFPVRVVDIFFGPMTSATRDSRVRRDQLLALPGKDEGYRTVLLVGTTGAGKTTVLRQLIGTDPETERFPRTATGRTTIADTEVIIGEGEYSAAVTFFSLDEVTAHLQDCVLQAVLASHRGEDRSDVTRSLLQHRDERFRFNYVLGDGPVAERGTSASKSGILANTSFATATTTTNRGMSELGDLPLDETNGLIDALVDRVIEISGAAVAQIEADLGPTMTEEDNLARVEMIEEGLDEYLRDDEAVHELMDALVDEMRLRFDLIGDTGELRRSRQGWPTSWSWSTGDRNDFFQQLRRFTSNSKVDFGRLLTPLVDGVRVRGPFRPQWHDGDIPKLVIIDTEGLGHTVDSASSISTKFTRLIAQADAVALVDSSKQPIQAAPAALLRSLALTGHGAKLHICFTHFDAVTGDNLPEPADRAMHVVKACDGVLARIGLDLGAGAESTLRDRMRDGAFFLADCHRTFNQESDELTIAEFRRLLGALQHSGERPTLAETRPVYDRTNLVVAVRDAVEGFHDHWDVILGRKTSPDVPKAHWASVKALSRRFAVKNEDGYRDLQPVADLHAWLQKQVWLMIQFPVTWTAGEPSIDEQQALYNEFATRLSERMLELSHDRIFAQRSQEWNQAFFLSGPHSTFTRASIIAEQIYTPAAPIPQSIPAPQQNEFLHRVVQVVRTTASELDIELR